MTHGTNTKLHATDDNSYTGDNSYIVVKIYIKCSQTF